MVATKLITKWKPSTNRNKYDCPSKIKVRIPGQRQDDNSSRSSILTKTKRATDVKLAKRNKESWSTLFRCSN